jgi:hypothetical protein
MPRLGQRYLATSPQPKGAGVREGEEEGLTFVTGGQSYAEACPRGYAECRAYVWNRCLALRGQATLVKKARA